MSWLFGGEEEQGAPPNGADTVEALCLRLQTANMAEDKSNSVRVLRKMAQSYKVEVGTKAVDPVMLLLKEDSSDFDMTVAAVEMLTIVLAPTSKPATPEDVGVMLTEMFVKNTGNVEILLKVLEENSFDVRLATVKLLSVMLTNCREKLQSCFLKMPQSISRIMDLLAPGSNEVIRNEALLLLILLTSVQDDARTQEFTQIQGIIAFENAFEKLFDIIQEEGQIEGGVIVQDCITLAKNLLSCNESNQSFFREAGCIKRLHAFLDIQTGQGVIWPAQKLQNMKMMLSLTQILLSSSNSSKNIAETQAKLQQQEVFSVLCRLSLSSELPQSIFASSLLTIGDAMRGSQQNQTVFATLGGGRALVILLNMSFTTSKSFEDRCAALYCFQCALYKNLNMKLKVAATFLPSGGESGPAAGPILCAGLVSKDAYIRWFSSLALSHMLVSTQEAKEKLLRVAIQQQGNRTSLLYVCISALPTVQPGLPESDRLIASLLILLSTWLSECPYAVRVFLEHPDSISFLVAQIKGSTSLLVQGLAGVTLGACIAYCDGDGKFSKEALINHVKSGPDGIDTYLNILDRFINSDIFSMAVKAPRFLDVNRPQTCWFDVELAKVFRHIVVTVSATINQPQGGGTLSPKAEAAGASVEHHEHIIASYKELIQQQDQEINRLKTEMSELASQQPTSTQTDSGDSAELQLKKQEVSELRAELELLKSNQTQNAQSDSDKIELERVRSQLSDLRSKCDEAQAKASQLEKANEGLQAELNAKPEQVPSGNTNEDAEMLQAARADINELTEQLAKMQEQFAEKDEKIKTIEMEKRKAEEEVGKLMAEKKEVEDAAPVSDESASKVSELESELEQVRAENEEVLVYLSDMDTKMKKYRDRLKALNEEVSESEEEDDEDDEEDEDED
eukprot:m.100861 g.100861  ORF g.100861 m.100861 type:complete len:906 (+) comp13727_c0_seq3:129-2846(+)